MRQQPTQPLLGTVVTSWHQACGVMRQQHIITLVGAIAPAVQRPKCRAPEHSRFPPRCTFNVPRPGAAAQV